MNVAIPLEFEQFVQSEVGGGMYKSVSDLFCEALSLLRQRDEARNKRITESIDRMDDSMDQAIVDSAKNYKPSAIKKLNKIKKLPSEATPMSGSDFLAWLK